MLYTDEYHQNNEQYLSIVVPAHNEDEVLSEFHRRLIGVMDDLQMKWEVIYVNDGSTDRTWELITSINNTDNRVRALDLSRNFGKEIAMTAGMDHAVGQAVVVIDADLQDPPELIPDMVEWWSKGYDVVYAKRTTREGESVVKKLTAYAFYRVANFFSRVPIPEDTGDYRLLSRRAADAVLKFREQHRFMKGLFAWIGFSQKAILYERDRRRAGSTKWNFLKLWNFALEGITSFTIIPLQFASYIGFLTALAAFIYALVIIVKTLVFGEPVRGFPTLMVTILFIGGIQLLTLGIIGEYLGRTFNEVQQRPLYFVKERLGDKHGQGKYAQQK